MDIERETMLRLSQLVDRLDLADEIHRGRVGRFSDRAYRLRLRIAARRKHLA